MVGDAMDPHVARSPEAGILIMQVLVFHETPGLSQGWLMQENVIIFSYSSSFTTSLGWMVMLWCLERDKNCKSAYVRHIESVNTTPMEMLLQEYLMKIKNTI